MENSSELFPVKSASRASLGKNLKPKENNIDECDELSDESPTESAGSMQDQVNIGVLEAESRQYQFNREGLYPLDGLPDKSAQQTVPGPGDYYQSNDIGLPRSKTRPPLNGIRQMLCDVCSIQMGSNCLWLILWLWSPV